MSYSLTHDALLAADVMYYKACDAANAARELADRLDAEAEVLRRIRNTARATAFVTERRAQHSAH